MKDNIYTPSTPHAKSASSRALLKAGLALNISIKNTAELLQLARVGLPADSFEAFTKNNGFARKDWDWIIPVRTLSHRRKGNGRLSIEESDKLIRAAKIQALAVEVLGSEDKATAWLHKPRAIFDGCSAMEQMKTELGAQVVEETLIQLDEGYF